MKISDPTQHKFFPKWLAFSLKVVTFTKWEDFCSQMAYYTTVRPSLFVLLSENGRSEVYASRWWNMRKSSGFLHPDETVFRRKPIRWNGLRHLTFAPLGETVRRWQKTDGNVKTRKSTDRFPMIRAFSCNFAVTYLVDSGGRQDVALVEFDDEGIA